MNNEFPLTFPQALLVAEEGKKIKCNRGYTWTFEEFKEHTYNSLSNLMERKWALVKAPEIYEVECEWKQLSSTGWVYPCADDAGNNFDYFNKLIGKRTKLRIEVIE